MTKELFLQKLYEAFEANMDDATNLVDLVIEEAEKLGMKPPCVYCESEYGHESWEPCLNIWEVK